MVISRGTYLVITIDSVGYEKTYFKLFHRLGLEYTTVTKRHHKQLQALRVYHTKRGELIAV
jgi:hypothetical protein